LGVRTGWSLTQPRMISQSTPIGALVLIASGEVCECEYLIAARCRRVGEGFRVSGLWCRV
jgi:hypothetical protein